MTEAAEIRFYFSFRSPYAWLAAERLDLDEDHVIAGAAGQAGLDPEEVLAFAHSPVPREETASAWAKGVERDGIFGVPSFSYAGRLYWGQDRMHFLKSAVQRKAS